MAAQTAEKRYRIVVLGAPGVGKSAIISQFMNKDILERHWFTIELEEHISTITHKGRQIILEVIDTPGGYCFGARRRMAIETGDAFILVFSLEDGCSFETVAMMRDDILRVKKKKKVPILLVSNKSDIEEERRITGVEGAQMFAKKEWKTKYVDACAKDKDSVINVFKALLKLARVKNSLGGKEKIRRHSCPAVSPKSPATGCFRRHSVV